MRAYSGQKPPSGSASINISESFFRNFSKNPTVDRSARPAASVMAEPAALAAWSAATEPVAIEPAALETEPIADRCGPLRRRYLVCVCVCRSESPHAAEGQSASPPSVRRVLGLGARWMPGPRLVGALRMKPSSPDLILGNRLRTARARTRSFRRPPIYDLLSMSVRQALRLALWIAADKVNAFSLMFCLSRGFRFFFCRLG